MIYFTFPPVAHLQTPLVRGCTHHDLIELSDSLRWAALGCAPTGPPEPDTLQRLKDGETPPVTQNVDAAGAHRPPECGFH